MKSMAQSRSRKVKIHAEERKKKNNSTDFIRKHANVRHKSQIKWLPRERER